MNLDEMIAIASRMRAREQNGTVRIEDFNISKIRKNYEIVTTNTGSVSIVRFTHLEPKEKRPVIINFHGGGFIKGRSIKEDVFCSEIAQILGCEVIDVDYKLAPEHRFPTAVNEVEDIVEWVFQNAESMGLDKSKIMLCGQSAGGNLAISAALNRIRNKDIMPVAMCIGWAPLDLKTDPGDKICPEDDLPVERARLYNEFYCSLEDTSNPLVSPVLADSKELAQLPKTLFIVPKQDRLAQENIEFARKLQCLHVENELHIFHESKHGFMLNRTGEWKEAMDTFIKYVEKIFYQ